LLSLLLLAACAIGVLATAAPFSSSHRAHVLSQLASQPPSSSAATTLSAVRAYKLLGEQVPNADKLCTGLSKELLAVARGQGGVARASAALAAASELQCPRFAVPETTKALLQTALTQHKTVEDMFAATQAVLALDQIKGAGLPLSSFSFRGVDSTLLTLLEEDGTVRPHADADEGSPYHAGLALQLLANLAKKVPAAVDKAVLRQFNDKVAALLSTAITGPSDAPVVDFAINAPADVTPLEAAASVLKGLSSLVEAGQSLSGVKKAQLISVGDFLLQNAFVADSDEAAALLSALQFVASNPVFVPFFVEVQAGSTPLQIRVTNALGQPTTKLSVAVESAKATQGGSSASIAARELTFTPVSDAADNTAFKLSADGAKALAAAAPGVYEFKLTVTPQSGGPAASGYGASSVAPSFQAQSGVTFVRKVSSASRDELVKGATVEVVLNDSAKRSAKDDASKQASARFPEKVASLAKEGGAHADASKHLHVRVRLSSTARATGVVVFLQLTPSSSASAEGAALFVLRSVEGEKGVYALSLALGSSEVLDSLSGAGSYAVSLLVGEALAEVQQQWSLGQLSLNIPAPSTPAGARTAAELDAFFSARPPIAHSFRPAEARSSVLVAGAFTLAVLGAFVGLLVALARSGLVSLNLPSSNPTEFLYALAFQGSIAGLLALYALYWLSLNIFQALALLAVLGTVAMFAGTGALSMLHQRRQQQTKGHVE
jgi:hypothetical protein